MSSPEPAVSRHFRHRTVIAPWTLPWFRVVYAWKAAWRRVRIRPGATRLLGAQYRRSRDMIEIDVTYRCNLRCRNCNRSCRQAPSELSMTVGQIRRFINESLAAGLSWKRIRLLGGEPLLHPKIERIVDELSRYRQEHPRVSVELVTNGYGEEVQARLAALPRWVWVENSRKTTPDQPSFGAFNLAPIDDPALAGTAFENGCAIARDCGMGLCYSGYYPCAVAGGIDRIAGFDLGRKVLPARRDEMRDLMRVFCLLCGRFREGHYIPCALRPALEGERISPTWERLYRSWRDDAPSLSPFPEAP